MLRLEHVTGVHGGTLDARESRTLDQLEQKTIQAVVLRKSSRKVLGVLKSPSQQVFDGSDLLTQQIQLARKTLNVGCSAAGDIKIEVATQAVFGLLPVLCSPQGPRPDGCQDGRGHGQEHKRVRSPRRV